MVFQPRECGQRAKADPDPQIAGLRARPHQEAGERERRRQRRTTGDRPLELPGRRESRGERRRQRERRSQARRRRIRIERAPGQEINQPRADRDADRADH